VCPLSEPDRLELELIANDQAFLLNKQDGIIRLLVPDSR
jgi:hypothetical protein